MKSKQSYKTGEKALTLKEYEKVLNVIDNLPDEVMLKLAIATGARREDAVNIKWVDVDEDNNCITFFERKKDRIKQVFVPPSLIMLLTKYKNSLGKDFNKGKHVTILPFNGKTAYNHFQKLCKKAGVPTRPFHALRATCIKFCQMKGWSVEAVSKHVGDTIEVIQRHYSIPSTSEMKEEAQVKPII
jgi:integrase